MLTHLRIKNLALVVDLNLEFEPGFNAITGETGAGKSILIGALSLLLGERADRTLLRAGADSCAVEGLVDVSRLRAPLAVFLAENGLEPCEGGQLILKRVFTATGTNRQFINGSPATLQVLSDLGEWLVDIHGPHDHQSLFQPVRQLAMLDAYAGTGEALDTFASTFRKRADAEEAKAALVVDERTYAQQLDLLRHQVAEITAARLQPGEEEVLVEDHRRAQNAARLLETGHGALALLSGDDDSLVTRTGQLGRLIQDLHRLDPGASELQALHEQIAGLLRDLQSGVGDYVERVDLDPARLQGMEERLNLIQGLRRKYGSSVGDVVAFGEEAKEKLSQLEGRDAELVRLNAEIARLDLELRRQGSALTAARRQAIPKLARAVMAQLRDLGFKRSEFDVGLTAVTAPGRAGFDAAEFLFAPNPGEPSRPLRAIASSGEIARVMLALKTVLASQDDIPVVVFDEVDANVGGETAHAVGEKMQQIGCRRQVLCITHLAPVAASAGHHLVVTKTSKDGRTTTEIAAVTGGERATELARMLGGGDAAQRHAEALLEGAPDVNDDFELVPLRRGGVGIRSVHYGEICHPGVGPKAEADEVYVRALGLRERLASACGELVVWDVGLGGAANAVSVIDAMADVGGALRVISFDHSAGPLRFALEHAGALAYFGGLEGPARAVLNEGRVAFQHGRVRVRWNCILTDFPAWVAGAGAGEGAEFGNGSSGWGCEAPHAILYDPHSPAANPEMWTLPLFAGLYGRLDAGRPCSLATYSRSTAVRVSLLLAGFRVGAGRGTATKEETTVAANVRELLTSPLDERWLERARRSGAAEPWVCAPFGGRPLSEETWGRLTAHPQFRGNGALPTVGGVGL